MKACLVYVSAMENEAKSLAAQLQSRGVEVCQVLVDESTADALMSGHGAIPDRIQECIKASDVCYFLLVGNTELMDGVGEGLRLAATFGKKIIAIVEGELPPAVDDVATTVLVPGSAAAIDAADSEVPSNHPSRAGRVREIDRVKCQ